MVHSSHMSQLCIVLFAYLDGWLNGGVGNTVQPKISKIRYPVGLATTRRCLRFLAYCSFCYFLFSFLYVMLLYIVICENV